MKYEEIRFEVREGIATVTLHRPEKLNAYTPRMGEELMDALARVRDDTGVRVVILAGAGRGFCAGVDLELLMRSRAGQEAGGSRLGDEAFLRRFPFEVAALPKPVIAAIHGAAVGVGVTMTLPCDVRLAADTARLGMPFAKLGLLPGLASSHFLPRLVGPARAKELVLTGRTLDAAEAAAIGLVNRVVPADALAGEAREMALTMAACDPAVLAAAKRLLEHGPLTSPEEALRREQAESAALRERKRT